MTLKCKNCNKKIKLFPFTCKCENNYCTNCRYPENHNCQYDFKNHQRNILKNQLVKVVCKKIDKI